MCEVRASNGSIISHALPLDYLFMMLILMTFNGGALAFKSELYINSQKSQMSTEEAKN